MQYLWLITLQKAGNGIMVSNNNNRLDRYLEGSDGERTPVRGRLTISILFPRSREILNSDFI